MAAPPTPTRRVAYIWSPHLQAAADALPANRGRSSRVHSLIRALGLVRDATAGDRGGVKTQYDAGDVGRDHEGKGERPGADQEGAECSSQHTSRAPAAIPSDSPAARCGQDPLPETAHESTEMEPRGGSSGPVPAQDNGPAGGAAASAARASLSPAAIDDAPGFQDEEEGSEGHGMDGDAQSTPETPRDAGDGAGPRSQVAQDAEDAQGAAENNVAVLMSPDLRLATEGELRKYHDGRYVNYLLRNGVVPDGGDSDSDWDSDTDAESNDDGRARKRRKVQAAGLEYDCPPFRELSAYARLVAASTLTACKLLVKGRADAAIAWDGGRHHAQRAQASGFCYVADAVLGILYLSREGVPCEAPWGQRATTGSNQQLGNSSNGVTLRPPTARRRPRILYLDMDLHYGDGVALAFQSPTKYPHPLRGRPRPPQVLTLSVHHAAPIFFPPGAPGTTPADSPHPFSLSYALAAYAHSPTYARAWRAVERVAAAWAPDYVVLQLGVDGLPRDPVGQYGAWGVAGEGGVPWAVARVMDWGRPTVVLGGGGYVSDNAARAWALATAEVLGRDLGPEVSVPDHAFWDEYAPGYTLEVPESHVPDENTPEALDDADAAFDVLAERIRAIVALHS